MELGKSASMVTVAVALISAAGGALIAGDARYVLTAVYAAEQNLIMSKLTSVKMAVLMSARRQIQSQIFHLETSRRGDLTTHEKQRLYELKNELADIQEQIKHAR